MSVRRFNFGAFWLDVFPTSAWVTLRWPFGRRRRLVRFGAMFARPFWRGFSVAFWNFVLVPFSLTLEGGKEICGDEDW